MWSRSSSSMSASGLTVSIPFAEGNSGGQVGLPIKARTLLMASISFFCCIGISCSFLQKRGCGPRSTGGPLCENPHATTINLLYQKADLGFSILSAKKSLLCADFACWANSLWAASKQKGRWRRPGDFGGGKGTRTPDIRLAKPTLSQLSYTPIGCSILLINTPAATRLTPGRLFQKMVGHRRFELLTSRLSVVRSSQLS